MQVKVQSVANSKNVCFCVCGVYACASVCGLCMRVHLYVG